MTTAGKNIMKNNYAHLEVSSRQNKIKTACRNKNMLSYHFEETDLLKFAMWLHVLEILFTLK